LGSLECELVEAHAARFLDDPDRLAAVMAATALLLTALPEREPNAELYQSFAALLGALTPTQPSAAPTLALPRERGREGWGQSGGGTGRGQTLDSGDGWPQYYVKWECGLLAALGFGLDLARCAVTGAAEDLAYVSPRTGRAVSRTAGLPYHDKLLPLPGFLWRDASATRPDIAAGLALTRYFLLHHLLLPHGRQLPEARERLAERMRRPQPLV
jgi:DNA repair protein RecO (recombination protein O)